MTFRVIAVNILLSHSVSSVSPAGNTPSRMGPDTKPGLQAPGALSKDFPHSLLTGNAFYFDYSFSFLFFSTVLENILSSLMGFIVHNWKKGNF